MNDTVVSHQRQRLQHLTREPPNERCREPNKAIGLDQLVQVDTEQLGGNAQMTTEVEMLDHLKNMVFLILILQTTIQHQYQSLHRNQRF